jgi:hypothetical protein
MMALPPSEGELFLERWEFLLPWCALLRGRVGIEGKFSELSALGDYWWVTVRLPSAAPVGEVAKLREALELLSLVAYVDNDAWKRLLLEHCHLVLDYDEEEIDGEFMPRFLLRFDESYLKYNSLAPAALLEQFFATHAQTAKKAPSVGYRNAVDTILAFHSASGAARTAVPWRIPLSIEVTELWNLSPAKVTAHLNYMLASLLEMQALQAKGVQITVRADEGERRLARRSSRDATVDGAALRYAHFFSYELESLKLCLGSIDVSESVPPVVLKLLSSPELNFAELQLCLQHSTAAWGETDGCASASSDRMTTGLLFNALFAGQSITSPPSTSSHTPFTRTSRVDSIVMQCSQADPWVLTCLSAAVAEARAVTKLSLDGYFDAASDTPEMQTWKWQWLAFAVFRRASHSSVKHLAVSKVRLTGDDVAAVATVIDSNWPELDSDLTAASLAESIIFRARVPKGTLIRLYSMVPHASDEICVTIDVVQDFECDVIDVDDNSSEWIDLIVPGYGRGCVRRSDVVVQASDAHETDNTSQDAGLESLTLTLDQDGDAANDAEALTDLLRLVGSSLRALSIHSSVPQEVDISLVMRFCPHLELLYLDSVQIDLDAFVAEVDAENASISSLMMTDFRIPDDQIARLATALANPSSAVARTLRELCLNPDSDEHPTTEDTLQALLSVLENNKRLEYLDLRLQHALYAEYADRLLAFHREVLPVEKEKLPRRCKLAFLSVLRSVMPPLDHHVVRSIFAFAGTCATRTVCIMCEH